MKEVFRNADSVLVGLYQSILGDAHIQTFVRNANTQQSLVAGWLTAIFPLPLFFPTLCVVNDEDYEEAMKILRGLSEGSSVTNAEWTCQNCGESVPGNFTTCWKCQGSGPHEAEGAFVSVPARRLKIDCRKFRGSWSHSS